MYARPGTTVKQPLRSPSPQFLCNLFRLVSRSNRNDIIFICLGNSSFQGEIIEGSLLFKVTLRTYIRDKGMFLSMNFRIVFILEKSFVSDYFYYFCFQRFRNELYSDEVFLFGTIRLELIHCVRIYGCE